MGYRYDTGYIQARDLLADLDEVKSSFKEHDGHGELTVKGKKYHFVVQRYNRSVAVVSFTHPSIVGTAKIRFRSDGETGKVIHH